MRVTVKIEGAQGSGKTTVVKAVVGVLQAAGLRVLYLDEVPPNVVTDEALSAVCAYYDVVVATRQT